MQHTCRLLCGDLTPVWSPCPKDAPVDSTQAQHRNPDAGQAGAPHVTSIHIHTTPQ